MNERALLPVIVDLDSCDDTSCSQRFARQFAVMQGLANGTVHVDEIQKSNFESTTAFHHSRFHLNAMRGFLVADKLLALKTSSCKYCSEAPGCI